MKAIQKVISRILGTIITLAMKALFPAFLLFLISIPIYMVILKFG